MMMKPEEKDYHTPRPMTPEDKSYREVMMLYSDQPVKPKYWFEDFGDYWSCSCGQINREDRCSNCGLDRDLLRKIFVVQKTENGKDGKSPKDSSGADIPGDGKDPAEDAPGKNGAHGDDSASDPDTKVAVKAQKDLQRKKKSRPEPSSEEDQDPIEEYLTEEDALARRRRRTRNIMIVLVLLLLMLGAALVGFYYYYLPQMERNDELHSDAVSQSLAYALPKSLDGMDDIHYQSLISAADSLYDDKKYEEAIAYYEKAQKIKKDDSIKNKIKAAKFSYVSEHQDDTHNDTNTFEKYLNELHKARYTGIQDIYNRYYSWKISIVTNDSPNDSSTDMETVSRSREFYFHTSLSGGTPDGSLRLYYDIIWPDGTSERHYVDSTKGSGETVNTRCQYTYPPVPGEGRLTFKLFDQSSNRMLATDSVRLSQ